MSEPPLTVSLDAPHEHKHHRTRTMNKSKHHHHQSINQMLSPSINQSTGQSINQSNNQSKLIFLELLLQRFPVLTSASPQALEDLSLNTVRKAYQKKDKVLSENERPTHVYIVINGEFALSKVSNVAFSASGDGLSLKITVCGRGEEVGMIALLKEVQTRLAEIEAEDPHGHHHQSINQSINPSIKRNFSPCELTMTCVKSGALFAIPINQLFDLLISCKHSLIKHVLTDVALHSALHNRRFKQSETRAKHEDQFGARHVADLLQQNQLSGTVKPHRLRSSQNVESKRVKETLAKLDDVEDQIDQSIDQSINQSDDEDAKVRTRLRAKKALITQSKSGRTVDQAALTAAVVRDATRSLNHSINESLNQRKQWQAELPANLLTDEDISDETKALTKWLDDRDRLLRARHETQQPILLTFEQSVESEREREKWKGQLNELIEEEEKEQDNDHFLSVDQSDNQSNNPRKRRSSLSSSPRHSHNRSSATIDLINRIAHANKLSHIVHPSAQMARSPSVQSRQSTADFNQSISQSINRSMKDWSEEEWNNRPSVPYRRPRLQSFTGPEYKRVAEDPGMESDFMNQVINHSDEQSINLDTSIDSPKFRSLVSQRQSSPSKLAVLISSTTNEPFLPTLPDGSINHELIRTVENGEDLLRIEEEDQSNNQSNQSPFPPQSFFTTEKETMEQLNSHLNDPSNNQTNNQSNNQSKKRVLGYSYVGLRGRNSSLASGGDTLDSIKARRARAAAEIAHRNERALMAVGMKPAMMNQSNKQSINQSITDPLQLAAMLNDSSASDKLILNNQSIESEIRAKQNLHSAMLERAQRTIDQSKTQSALQYFHSLLEANKLNDVAEIAEILTREKLGSEACKAFDHAVESGGLLPAGIQKLLSDSVASVAADLKQVEAMRDEWRRQSITHQSRSRQRASMVLEQCIEADENNQADNQSNDDENEQDEYSDSEDESDDEDHLSDDADDGFEDHTIVPSRFGALHSMIAESAEQAQQVREQTINEDDDLQSMSLQSRMMSNSVTRRTFQADQTGKQSSNQTDVDRAMSIGVEQATERTADQMIDSNNHEDSDAQSVADSLAAPPMVDDRCYTAPTRFVTTPDISKLVLPTVEDEEPLEDEDGDQSIDESVDYSNVTSVTVTTRSDTTNTHRSNQEVNIMTISRSEESEKDETIESDTHESASQNKESESEEEESDDDEYVLAEDEWDELLPIQPEALELPLPDTYRDQTVDESEFEEHSSQEIKQSDNMAAVASSDVPPAETVVARDFLLGEDVSLIRLQVQANIEHETEKLREILAREAAERQEIERREAEQVKKAEQKRLKAEQEERDRLAAIEAEKAAVLEKERRRKEAEEAKAKRLSPVHAEKEDAEVPVDILSLFHPTTPPAARQRMKMPPVLKSIDESRSPRHKKGKGQSGKHTLKPTKSKVRAIPAQVMSAKPSTAPVGGRGAIKPVRPEPKSNQLETLDAPVRDTETEAQAVFSSLVRYQLLKRALEQASAEIEHKQRQQTEIQRAKLIAQAKAAKSASVGAAPFVVPVVNSEPTHSNLSSPTSKINQVEQDAAAARAAIARLQAENEQRHASEISRAAMENSRLEEERRLRYEAKAKRKAEKEQLRNFRRERRASSLVAHESKEESLVSQQSIRFAISPAESPKPSSNGHSARSHNGYSPSSTHSSHNSSRPGTTSSSPRSMLEPSPFDPVGGTSDVSPEPASDADLSTEAEEVPHEAPKKHKKKRKHAATSEHSKAQSAMGSSSSSDNEEDAADGDLHDMANGSRAKIRVESEFAGRDYDSLPPTRHSSHQSIYHLDHHLAEIGEFDCTVILEDAIQRETSAVFDERYGGYMPKNFFTYQFAADAPTIKLIDPRTHSVIPLPFEYDDHPLRAKQRLIEARGASEQEAVAAAEKEIKSMIENRQSMKAYATRTKESQTVNKRKHALAYLEREALKQITSQTAPRASISGSLSGIPGSFGSLSVPSDFDTPSIPLLAQAVESKTEDSDEQARMREQQQEMHSRLVSESTEWQREQANRQSVAEEFKESITFSSSGFSPKSSAFSPSFNQTNNSSANGASPVTKDVFALSQSAAARLKLGGSTHSVRQAAIKAVADEVDRTIDEQIKREIFDPSKPLVSANGSLFPPIRAPVQSNQKTQQHRGNGSFNTFSDMPASQANAQPFGQMPFAAASKARTSVSKPQQRR